MLGKSVVKTWSSNQSVIALSSGEAEYYALVKGASQGIGIRNILGDIGVESIERVQVLSDASAAIGIASRRGSGKVRHIEVNQLWLQDKVLSGDIEVTKIGTGQFGRRTNKTCRVGNIGETHERARNVDREWETCAHAGGG